MNLLEISKFNYEELSQEELDILKEIENAGVHLSYLINEIQTKSNPNPHWIEVAKTHLHLGMSGLVKSISKED